MTDTITKPRVSAAAKTALVLAAAAVLLAVFALAAPGSRFFFPAGEPVVQLSAVRLCAAGAAGSRDKI